MRKNLEKFGKMLGILASATEFLVKFLLSSFPIRRCGKPASAESKKRAFNQARRAIKNNNRGQENGIFNNRNQDIDYKMNSNRFIGCCGAYCKTCKSFIEGVCKGCKIGFDTGERDITKAKCKIKVCCFRDHKFDTCADCSKLESCNIIGSWYTKKGYKYKKYKEAIEFIKKNGYGKFLKSANKWNGAYGKLE